MKLPSFAFFKKLLDPAGLRKYVTQVSLILLSLAIATSVDRCRERGKNEDKLREYLTAIQGDIANEIKTDKMNLYDCQRDQRCLEQALRLIAEQKMDSTLLIAENIQQVFDRGVFRDFYPTTFELMAQNGDANLLKNLPLRNHLASIFAFRQNVIKKDFENFDQETRDCMAQLGRYIDFMKVYSKDAKQIFTDEKGFMTTPRTELYLLARSTDVKAFHLQNAIEDLQEVQANLDAELKK